MMESKCFVGRRPVAMVISVLFLCITAACWAQEGAVLPQGMLEFAGRISRHHSHLWGEGARVELEQLNRQLRESAEVIRKTASEAERQVAAERGRGAADRLLDLVRSCPVLIRLNPEADGLGLPEGIEPLTLPGDTGALLFEVVRGGGPDVQFATGWSDLAKPQGESARVTMDVGETGVTYGVVGLENVPVGLTTLTVELRSEGRPAVSGPLTVRVPEFARLRVTVLSDDTGEPVPAMVRLVWRTDGLLRRPSNGVEFAPQFDQQGNASGARAANLPGELGRQFWCVPGPFDMALPPGVWQIGVRRGTEHEVLFDEVTLASGAVTHKVFRPRRWVDMRERGWWSGDDHVHCRILSEDDARNLMAWVRAEDVHLANVVKMGDITRTYFEQRGFGPDYRMIEGDTVLVPGQECPRTHDQIGHTLAMNITSMVRDTEEYYLYDKVFDAVHTQGGLTGYAHINSGLFHVHRDMSLNVVRGKVDFGEILQFNRLGTELYYEFLNLGCKLTASAGSDVPWGGTVGEVRVYVFLGEQPFSADAWFEAFRRGRTFTTSGPMVELQVEGALPGDELRVRDDRPLRVRARAWGDPRRMKPMTLEIVRHGQVIRSAESAGPDSSQAALDFEMQAGHGCWLAARVRSGEGTSAHTSPVYVVREGFRFWDYDGIEGLLSKRAESLRQIEAIVAEARQLDAAGRLVNDRSRQQLARQGEALLERVRELRQVYEGLRQQAAAERSLRDVAR